MATAHHPTGVLGFGRTGASAARALAASGHTVVVWDDAAAGRRAAAESGFAVRELAPPLARIVASPGVAPAHPQLQAAARAGIPVWGDIDEFSHRLAQDPAASSTVIGVTGTNGKSSAVAMIEHLLRACGRSCAAGGNLGTPALDLPHPLDGVYVLELSSFQLARCRGFRPDVALLLNIGTDHLDWHGTRGAYVAAKEKIFQTQRPEDAAVICIDDVAGERVRERLAARTDGPRVIAVSARRPCPGGIWVEDGVLCDELDGGRSTIGSIESLLQVPGRHNWQNAVAAWAAARLVGAPSDDLAAALADFRGLPHRLEALEPVAGVAFINDSKATNVAAAAAALACFDRVCWVAGGRGKDEDLDPLVALAHRIDAGFFFGEDGPVLEAAFATRAPVARFERMDAAVTSAFARARRGSSPPPVLLSPACASYDQFADFEARGAAFRAVVEAIARTEA